MNKISGSTKSLKKTFPAIWFVLFGIFVVGDVLSPDGPGQMTVGAIVMSLLGLVFFKYALWDLVDEVYDCGETLHFRRGSTEQRVSLSEIVHIDHSVDDYPETVTIYCRSDGPIGTKIRFCLPESSSSASESSPYPRPEVVSELLNRVNHSRIKVRT